MSAVSNYYAIVGYDLTDCEADMFDEWIGTDVGEKYTNCQQKDKIQFFDDPADDTHLYFGYILACGNEYEMDAIEIDVEQIADKVDLAKKMN